MQIIERQGQSVEEGEPGPEDPNNKTNTPLETVGKSPASPELRALCLYLSPSHRL